MVIAAGVLLAQVQVNGGQQPVRSCGSAWDVVAGRTGWSQWWSADLTDHADGADGAPVRTVRCPAAVNRRVVASGSLAVAAIAVVAAGEALGRRRPRQQRPQRPPEMLVTRRVRRLGTGLTALGSTLTVAGLSGLGLLVADPRSSLFLYVSRTAVALAGLLLVLPAVLLIALGRTAAVAASYLTEREADHDRS